MPQTKSSLTELYQLAQQLELDAQLPLATLRERDHRIAADCTARDDPGRLRFWLARVSLQQDRATGSTRAGLSEASAAALGRTLALCLGFAGMATFLLASGRGLVNVFMFLLLFVVVQLLLSLVAAAVMLRAAGGQQAVMLPLNPARLLLARRLPDLRYLREAQSVIRLLLLRYGQELGAIFTLGAIGAFFLVLAVSDFTFVWGSTFALSDSLVQNMTSFMASPWATWLPQATVGGDLIFASRFHPANSALAPADIAAMRGWWPFLIMCMVCYAMVPRIVLWLFSRLLYARGMHAAFIAMPGSDRVLARMKAPLVRTQGEGTVKSPTVAGATSLASDPDLVLLNWAGALAPGDISGYQVLAGVADSNIFNVGQGALDEELQRLAAAFSAGAGHVYVAVKSWEPPMADLADFLAHFSDLPRCTVLLVPLGAKPVAATNLEDWQVFSRSLEFAAVDLQVLERD